MRAMLRSTFQLTLLVFTLLFAQLGGLTHGIAHTLAEQSQDQSLPHDKLCDLCASYAQLGSALGSTAHHFATETSVCIFQPASAVAVHRIAFSAFAARAPPYSV